LKEKNHVEGERVDCETIPNVDPVDSQSVTNVLKEEELLFEESLFENIFCSREALHSINSSTCYFLYPDLFNGLILQESTHCPIQINSMGPTPFEVLNGGNVHMEDREDKASSHELCTNMPYQPFSWNEGNFVADVYQMMSHSLSSSFFINKEYSCSSISLVEIVDVSGFQHCLKYFPYTMVGASPYISFHSTNLAQVVGFLKYESMEVCQDNEALQSTLMVMTSPHYFGLYLGINKFIITKTLSPSTLHTYFIHSSHFLCYFPMNSLHQFYVSHGRFYDRIESWLEGYYSDRFPMNYHYDIFNMVDRVFYVLIFHTFNLFLFQVLLLFVFIMNLYFQAWDYMDGYIGIMNLHSSLFFIHCSV
jgi:hypothetical protein